MTHTAMPADNAVLDPADAVEPAADPAVYFAGIATDTASLQETFSYDHLTVGEVHQTDAINFQECSVFKRTVLILNRTGQTYDVEYAIRRGITYFRSLKKYGSPEFVKIFGFQANCKDFVEGKIIQVRRFETSNDCDRIVQRKHCKSFTYHTLTVGDAQEQDMILIEKYAVFQPTMLIISSKNKAYDVEYATVNDTTYFKSLEKYRSHEFEYAFGFRSGCNDFVKGKIIVVRSCSY